MSTLLEIVSRAIESGLTEFEVTDSTGRSWGIRLGNTTATEVGGFGIPPIVAE